MKFLKTKFNDTKQNINHFLTSKNELLKLESDEVIQTDVKKEFVQSFIDKLIAEKVVPEIREIIDNVRTNHPNNHWSIDFPSWAGEFHESRGKKLMVIGAEPHIHFKYLQTVYHLHNNITVEKYLNEVAIFKFLTETLSNRLKLSKEEVLNELYLTDLFPLSPFRGNGVSVGSADKLQKVIEIGNWTELRYEYARKNLPFEIEGVSPKLIIAQGKQVFLELIRILGIKEILKQVYIKPKSGKGQYIRKAKWNNIDIISVPHIGSKRMKTFWTNNLDQIKELVADV